MGNDVIVLDALGGEDLHDPSHEAPAQEDHGGLGSQVPGSFQREGAGSQSLPTRQSDPDDIGHFGHAGRSYVSHQAPERRRLP